MNMSSSNTCDTLKSVLVVSCSHVLVFVMWISSGFMLSFDCGMCSLFRCVLCDVYVFVCVRFGDHVSVCVLSLDVELFSVCFLRTVQFL